VVNLNHLIQRFENIARNGVTEVNDEPITAPELHNIMDAAYAMLLSEIYRAPCDHTGTRWTREGKTFCGVCSREVDLSADTR
jgi:hypothetical protein